VKDKDEVSYEEF